MNDDDEVLIFIISGAPFLNERENAGAVLSRPLDAARAKTAFELEIRISLSRTLTSRRTTRFKLVESHYATPESTRSA
jgi:hypothetical protein